MEQKRETREGQLVFDKGANVLKRKRITSLTNSVGITGKNMKKNKPCSLSNILQKNEPKCDW